MKFSLGFTLLVLAIGGSFGWRQQQRLARLEHEQSLLETRAITLGIAPDAIGARTARRLRQSTPPPSLTTGELIALTRELDDRWSVGEAGLEDLERRAMTLMERLLELDPGQLAALIAGLRADPELNHSIGRDLVLVSLGSLAEDRPAASLELVRGNLEWFGDGAKDTISQALGHWARLDPAAALAWLRDHSALPGVDGEDARQHLIIGSALNDPRRAFQLIRELKPEDSSGVIDSMIGQARTLEQKAGLLEALRGYLAGVPDLTERDEARDAALEKLGGSLADASFDSAQRWLADAKLAPEEKAGLAAGLAYDDTQQDTGRWIEWMAANLPESTLIEPVASLIGQWTEQDYRAAGSWLAAATDGPAKQAAIQAYVGTIAETDPQVAIQWADTLPPGETRQQTDQAIHRNWPAGDPAGAAAFGAARGLPADSGIKAAP